MSRLIGISVLLSTVLSIYAQDNRIEYNGQELFLNGANLAWIDFANDIGTDNVDFRQFGAVFREMHDYGANSVRLWLHTNGTTTPRFNADTVVGPGIGAIDDLIQILDSAYRYDVGVILSLWSFDMLRESTGEPYLSRNRKILEEDAALNSYIEYALKPMVDSAKDHPAIIAWEVFNEPEGMVEGIDYGGWGGIGHVLMSDVQRVVNRIAGAIHRINPDLQVTNGTHTLYSLSDRGIQNFYADSELFNAGGDADGYLDFYQVHFYDFDLNPFEHQYDYWNLDKPLILGEFHPGCSTCGEFSNYETLIDSGYAGALGWMWLDSYGGRIQEEVQYLFLNKTPEVDIDNMLGDTPALYFSGPEYGSVFEAGSDIPFSADAQDTDGSISMVEFLLANETGDDSVLFADIEIPYEFTWVDPDEGTYRVYARATDNDGYRKESSKLAFTIGDPPRYRYEAEEAEIAGNAWIQNDTEASNGKYVNFQSDCSLEWIIPNCPSNNTYQMIIGYAVPSGEKNNYIVINQDVAHQIDWHFGGPSGEWLRDTLSVNLLEGLNTIAITDFWGGMDFDFIEFSFARPPFISQIILSTATGNDFIDIPGGSLQMIATIEPEEASGYPVEWRINNGAIASIDQSGLLTAIGNGIVNVIAVATDGSDISSGMNITLLNQPSAIEQPISRIMVYPNPVSDVLYFQFNDIVESIEIYSAQSIRANSCTSDIGAGTVEVSDLQEGVYFIWIRFTNGNKQVGVFVKKDR